jgi:hypothetical protein
VSRAYTVRDVTESDRQKYARMVRAAESRGDIEDAESYRESLAKWETEQGEEREAQVCAVCGDPWLTPTASGTARRHRRRDGGAASWGRVRELRKEIAILNQELDRQLLALEPD